MATYTYTTTAQEEQGITHARTRANDSLPEAEQFKTNAAYVAGVLKGAFESYMKTLADANVSDLHAAFTSADPSVQARILASLGANRSTTILPADVNP